jgi:Calx-beta domain
MLRTNRGAHALLAVSLLLAGLVARGAAAQAPDPSALGPHQVTTEEYTQGDQAFTPSNFPAAVEFTAAVFSPTDIENGPYPIVLYLHGRHYTCGTSTMQWPCPSGLQPIKSYRGYDYSAQQLASHGYIVVSVSANGINAVDNGVPEDYGATARAELIDRHLEFWRALNAQATPPFGSKFVGRVDLARVGTMGHSRGGEGVMRHVGLNAAKPAPFPLKVVVPIAPTNFRRWPVNDKVAVAQLLSYCDGDVGDVQGVHYFDDARYLMPTGGFQNYVAVMGGNHNFYNATWTPGLGPGATDDWSNPNDPFCGTGAGNGRLTPGRQRDVGIAFLASFFRGQVGGENAFFPYIDGSGGLPPSVSGLDLHVSYHGNDAQRRDLDRLEAAADLTVNSLGGTSTQTGLVPHDLCGGEAPQPQSCLVSQPDARMPHTVPSALSNRRGLSQLRTGWSGAGASWVNDIPEGSNRDVSGFDFLQFRASVNFADSRNAPGMARDFSITFTDETAASQTLRVGEFSNALFFPPGTQGSVPKVWLNTVQLPLSSLTGVDKTRISRVAFTFDQSASGALLISDVHFYRATGGGDTGGGAGLTLKALPIPGGWDQVQLDWTVQGEEIEQFRVQRQKPPAGWVTIQTLGPGERHFTDVVPEIPNAGGPTIYYYRVFGDYEGSSIESNRPEARMYGDPPATPDTLRPRGCIASVDPTLSWHGEKSTSYNAYLVNTLTAQSWWWQTTEASSPVPAPLVGGTAYLLKVIGQNNIGNGSTSNAEYFVPSCSPTSPPIIETPIGCTPSLTPEVRWTPASSAQAVLWYHLVLNRVVDIDTDPEVIIGGVDVPGTQTSWTVPPGLLTGGQEYRVKVYAFTGVASDYSQMAFFKPQCSANGLPGTATPIAPGGTVLTSRPTYVWHPASQATSHTVQVYTTAWQPVLAQAFPASTTCDGATCSARPLQGLPDATYHWRVLGANAFGAAQFGVWATFTVSNQSPFHSVAWTSAAATAAEGGPAALAVRLMTSNGAPTALPVRVTYAATDGSATAGQDYPPVSGALTFPAGSADGAILGVTVPTLDDAVDEPSETFAVTLDSVAGAVIDSPSTATVTITDDDAASSVSVQDLQVAEGDEGQHTGSIGVAVAPSGFPITVTYQTASGTAAGDTDYVPTSGTLTFPPGATYRTAPVAIVGDAVAEPNEWFYLNLVSATNATIADGQGNVTILNDDAGFVRSVELAPGMEEVADLRSVGKAPTVHLYRLGQRPRSSYEIVVDATSGDVATPSGIHLERYAPDQTTLLQGSTPLAGGVNRSLRFSNDQFFAVNHQFLKVWSSQCTTDCGPDDVYRIRAFDTTYSVPRFNNSGQTTILLVQNTSAGPVSGWIDFWDAGGTLLGSSPLAVSAKGVFVLNTSTVMPGLSGSITISNDGSYSDLVGKAVSIEPATGFAFDTPLSPRPR